MIYRQWVYHDKLRRFRRFLQHLLVFRFQAALERTQVARL